MKCDKCKRDAVDNETLCFYCKDKRNARRNKRIADGVCLDCKSLAVQGKRFCQRHIDVKKYKAKDTIEKRMRLGLCVQCKAPSQNQKCDACKSKRLEHLKQRYEKGFCESCNELRLYNSKYCKYHNDYHINFGKRKRQQVLDAYGGKCVCCNENNPAFLAIDHINNDGSLDRNKGIRSQQLIIKIIRENFPDKYQILCHNCNTAKHFWPGGCPHQQNENLKNQKSIMHQMASERNKLKNDKC